MFLLIAAAFIILVVIGALGIFMNQIKDKEDELSKIYSKQAKFVAITLIIVEVLLILSLAFLTKMGL